MLCVYILMLIYFLFLIIIWWFPDFNVHIVHHLFTLVNILNSFLTIIPLCFLWKVLSLSRWIPVHYTRQLFRCACISKTYHVCVSVCVSVCLSQLAQTFIYPSKISFYIFRILPRFSESHPDFRMSSRFSEFHPDFQKFTHIFGISPRFSEFHPDFQNFT